MCADFGAAGVCEWPAISSARREVRKLTATELVAGFGQHLWLLDTASCKAVVAAVDPGAPERIPSVRFVSARTDRMKQWAAAVLALTGFRNFRFALAQTDDHGHDHGHDHGDGAFEWAGIFDTPNSNYLWTAQKTDGGYADPTLKMVALPTATVSKQALSDLEAQGETAMEATDSTCTRVQSGGTITPANTCYILEFQSSAWQSLFNIDASATAGIAFFTNHGPTEFEADAHYLKDSVGEDIEPVAALPEATVTAAPETPYDWGLILAAVLVNVVTFIGVVLLFSPLRRLAEKPVCSAMLFAFAAGALLACAFFLLLFEATHLIGTGWTSEVDIVWRWGAMILAGMIVPPVVETVCSLVVAARGSASQTAVAETSKEDAEGTALNEEQKFRVKARLLGAVLIGDFFHNLCDGFFIGAAFQVCGNAFGWSVATGTILHELPQEIADFVVLTGPGVSLSPVKALLANFASGLSVVIGAIIVSATPIDDSVIGLILAFGGGVYLHVGATDCLPKMYDPKLRFVERLAAMLAFVVGTVLIGLILIGHEHCYAPASEGEGGHGHSHGHSH